jgi:hypothetical protein
MTLSPDQKTGFFQANPIEEFVVLVTLNSATETAPRNFTVRTELLDAFSRAFPPKRALY